MSWKYSDPIVGSVPYRKTLSKLARPPESGWTYRWGERTYGITLVPNVMFATFPIGVFANHRPSATWPTPLSLFIHGHPRGGPACCRSTEASTTTLRKARAVCSTQGNWRKTEMSEGVQRGVRRGKDLPGVQAATEPARSAALSSHAR